MNEYEKKFANTLVIKHVPPVQLKTKNIKAKTNNDCEQYCAHIIGYGIEFFGKTEKEVKEKAKDFLKRTERGEFIPGVLPYDIFISIQSIGLKYLTDVKYYFISPDGEEEIKVPSQMANGQQNNVPLFNGMYDTSTFFNNVGNNIPNMRPPFNTNINPFSPIRYVTNNNVGNNLSTSTKVDSTSDSIQLPVLIEEIITTTGDKQCNRYSGYVYGLDIYRFIGDSISEVISKCNELVSKIDIHDILTPKTVDGKPLEDHIIKTLKYFSTKGRTVMLSYCTKKLI